MKRRPRYKIKYEDMKIVGCTLKIVLEPPSYQVGDFVFYRFTASSMKKHFHGDWVN